ncbi:Acid protease [Mycena venus]|uniref:Acid protease n=1 Tax=Mycena venus TaxID=2733690 RepID=A0A8H6XS59_9AGAR|nr:Acid protease [Mycena venus]
MAFLSIIFLLSLLGAAHAEPNLVRHRVLSPRPQQNVTLLPPAEFSVPLSAKAPRRKSKMHALSALRGEPVFHGSANTIPINGADMDEEYLTNVTVGGQQFQLVIDTGSSDTWIAKEGYSCFDLSGNPAPQSTCAFGSAGFDTAASKTFRPFSTASFNVTYGDGEFAAGPVGFDTMAVGGLVVTDQEIALPTVTGWQGDGFSTGILGLAFPLLTKVFNSSDPAKGSPENHIPYDPFFTTAIKQKKLKNPIFSVALNRGTFKQEENDTFDANLGFLSFGGIAPVPVAAHTSVTVPIQGYTTTTVLPSNAPTAAFFWYTVDVQSYTFPGSTGLPTASNNTILDTGTTLNKVPAPVAAAFAAAFVPPAAFNADFGLYLVDCNATAPEFRVTIGGTTFTIDTRDQIWPAGFDAEGNLLCATGTQDGGDQADGQFILGDVFLHNVVATFNPVAGEITLTQREKY